MTLQEFKNDGCFYVRVKDHKTTHGPADVVFNLSLHKYTQIFIEKLRNTLLDVNTNEDAPVFITWNQRMMTSSHVGAQVGSCWEKVFGKESSVGKATAFRKAGVFAVHEHNEELQGWQTLLFISSPQPTVITC